MNKYELLYILEAKLDDATREKEIEKVSKQIVKGGGEVELTTKTAPWGLKKLAYPIDYKKEGFYVLVNFASPADAIAPLEHSLKLTDNVIRYKVINRHA